MKIVPAFLTLLFSAVIILSIIGCAPTVHLATPEPIKVDIAIQVDVYQKDLTAVQHHLPSDEELTALRRRDNRSGEIWALKNDGAATEGERGYLEARERSGWDPKYVARLVAEENRDRHTLYEAEAQSSARPLSVVETEAGRRLRRQTYLNSQGASPDSTAPPAVKK